LGCCLSHLQEFRPPLLTVKLRYLLSFSEASLESVVVVFEDFSDSTEISIVRWPDHLNTLEGIQGFSLGNYLLINLTYQSHTNPVLWHWLG